MAPPNRTETEKRLKKLEEDNAQLRADLGAFIHEACPHLNTGSRVLQDLKARHSPGALETRPLAPLPEQRAKVVA